MDPSISVVVPSFNRREALLRLLGSLVVQDLPPDEFEAIVVLDGSNDGSAEAVRGRTWPFALRLIEQPNAGAGAARNTGTRAAAGRICVFVDDDVVLRPGSLRGHLAAHVEQPQEACVAGYLETVAEQRGIQRDWARNWNRQMGRLAEDPARMAWMGLYSGNLSLPRELALRFLFREDLRRGEDTELGKRLRDAGVPTVFSPAAAGTQFDRKGPVEALADIRAGGEAAVRLARDTAVQRGEPVARPWPFVTAAWVSSLVPLPDGVVRGLGALPHRLPGARLLFRGMRQHAYLRGVGREIHGYRAWASFLRRGR